MWICKDCGEVFEEPIVTRDDPSPAGVSLSSGYYEFESCPRCESFDIEKATECRSCGEWFDGDMLCDNCKEELYKSLIAIRDDMNLTQDDFEQAICVIFGW